jgi:hypothetical protein
LISRPPDDTLFGAEGELEAGGAFTQPPAAADSGGADKSERPPLAEIH